MGTSENALIVLTIFHVSLLLSTVIAVNPTGLTMKIFHRDSKNSPLYPGDHLTQEERLYRLIQQSKARAHYLGSKKMLNKTNSINPDVARLPLAYQEASFYIALVGIGTFDGLAQPFKNYYLLVDSGSDLIWTQCQGAVSYFHQEDPLYPAADSRSYQPLRCNDRHPFCDPSNCDDEGICHYEEEYLTSSVTSGVLAKEKFTVNSDNDGLQSFDIIMGCGTRQENFGPVIGSGFRSQKPDVIAGILGMDGGPRSFINQLGPAAGGRFEYCLQPYTAGVATSTYLRFGSDVRLGAGEGQQQVYSSTPLFSQPDDPGAYFLHLEGISIGRNRLPFRRSDFKYNEDTNRGGCIIDSGSPITLMHGPIFDRVAESVDAYFRDLDIHRIGEPRGYFDLCFSPKPKKDKDYPSMTFHFQDADFVMDKSDTVFSIGGNDFCLGIVSLDSDYDVLFGAMQQARKRILHDLMRGTLSFAAEECQLAS
ncbi:aspartic proteinase CDR1-like [Papaver somniferum]|uniref:aspartic proteinase CDR1-like n=1 Tax=Papaver somniferum TaxID=3469 RepID=UPI000E6FE53C|nr:aspartic proteinase CDR1-like [Papaver somniferum]